MERYIPNRFCNCPRCRLRGVMGPALLVTLGVLFLLDSFGQIRFHYTWPVILIVIGVIKVLTGGAAITGHRNYWNPGGLPSQPTQPPSAPAGTEPDRSKQVGNV